MLSASNKLLEQGFNTLNRIYFDNILPKAVITIQSAPKSYGYITVQKVWHNSEDSYYEINISAEHLARPIEAVFATLMHEMVHLYCMVNKIQDVSGGGRYHNKNYKKQAEIRDLIIEYAKYIGYSKTSASEKFVDKLKENGLYTNIDYCRATGNSLIVPPTGGDSDDFSNTKKKSSTRKYICDGCGTNIRATKNVNIICADCMTLMVKVE